MRFSALVLGALFLNIFAYIMIKARPVIYKTKEYKPMIHNMKLSVLPLLILLANIAIFIILSIIGAYTGIKIFPAIGTVLFFAGLLAWLLFLPNSGYLITELNLNHRSVDEKEVPIWYDIAATLSLALSGVLNTLLNIVIIQTSFLVVFDPQMLALADYLTLFLSGAGIIILMVTGIYLGRTLRLNSWDILHPGQFAAKLRNHFGKIPVWKDFTLYVALNAIFFLIIYVAFGIPFYFM